MEPAGASVSHSSGVSDLEDREISDSISSLLLAESQRHYFISSSMEIAALGQAAAESPAVWVQAKLSSPAPLDSFSIVNESPQMTRIPQNSRNFQNLSPCFAQAVCTVSKQQPLDRVNSSPYFESPNCCFRPRSESSVIDFSSSSTPDHALTSQFSPLPDRQSPSTSCRLSQSSIVVNVYNMKTSRESFCATDDISSVHGAEALKSMSKTELYRRNDKSAWKKGRYSDKTKSARNRQRSWKTTEKFAHAEKILSRATHLSEDQLGESWLNDDEDREAVVFWVETHDLNPDDGYGWRKYGQKSIKGHIYPRSYLKCDHTTRTGCPVKKRIQRLTKHEDLVEIVYEQRHNHPPLWLDPANCI